MAKKEGTKIGVLGGSAVTLQQYAGTVGGQSTSFTVIDSEIKSTKLKSNALAPPDFIGNSYQGLTWRLGFGINDNTEPEEWQNHQPSLTMGLLLDKYVICLFCDRISYLMLFIVSIAHRLSGTLSPNSGGLTCNRSLELCRSLNSNYAA
jgi:hypothetical protein